MTKKNCTIMFRTTAGNIESLHYSRGITEFIADKTKMHTFVTSLKPFKF